MKLKELYTAQSHEAGSEVRIVDIDGENTDLYIKVKGVESKTVRQFKKKRLNAYVESKQANKEFDEDAFIIDGLLEATIGWRGTDEEFTKELCRELYTEAPHVAEQVDDFIADKRNFTKAKRKKS